MERENGNGEGRETDLGMGRLMFVSFSWVGYLPPVDAEKEPGCAKLMMLFFASDRALPEEADYKQVLRLTIQGSSQD